jgi:2-dehydropantoate 2-reductase
MKVAVVGPGAMGCLFASRLANAGVATTLVDYLPDRIKRLQNSGIRLDSSDGSITSRPDIAPSVPPGQDLVIVCVKSYSTEALDIPNDAPVFTFQCGLNNIETLCSKVGSGRVLAGINTAAAELVAEGHARLLAPGLIQVGAWTSYPTAGSIKLLQSAGFKVEESHSPGQAIWQRVAVYGSIAPVSALVNLSNGKVIENQNLRQLVRDLVVEAVKVAAMEGYRFETSLVEEAERYCRETAAQTTSMLRDVRAGKATEIDALSGEILHRGQLAGLPTPRTRVVYQLVKGLSKS